MHNLYVYACVIFCSSNFPFFAMVCSICEYVCATSLYLVNKLVTCSYSI